MNRQRRQNEAVLACEAGKGDKRALRELLVRNWSWLRGLVYGILGGGDDVDDCLQDICVRVIEKIDTLREPERFRPWLAVLAKRQALGFRRRRGRRPVLMDEEVVESQSDEGAREFVENLERKELCEQVLAAALTLPEKYREVFLLTCSGELTYARTAEILDVPVTTMQIRLVRARKMILNKVTAKKDKVT